MLEDNEISKITKLYKAKAKLLELKFHDNWEDHYKGNARNEINRDLKNIDRLIDKIKEESNARSAS